MARKTLTLDLSREDAISLAEAKAKAKAETKEKAKQTRERNKILTLIQRAWDLLRSGELVAEGKITTITTKDALRAYADSCMMAGEYVLDYETTAGEKGDALDVFNNIVVGLALFSPLEGSSAYIPINHVTPDGVRIPEQLTEEEVKEILRPLLTSKAKGIFHHGKFDGKVCQYKWGYKIGFFFFDTLVAGHLLNENERHGLKFLYNKYILRGQGSDKDFEDYFGKNVDFRYVPIEVASVYGGNDGWKTYRLKEFQHRFLRPDHEREDFRKLAHVLFDIEMPLIQVLINMELRGITIREDFAKSLEEEFLVEKFQVVGFLDEFCRKYEEKILAHERLKQLSDGGKINYGSPEQLSAFLYDVLKCPSVSRNEPRGTGEDILLRIKDRAKKQENRDFIDLLLKLRGIEKLLGTYVSKMPKIIEPKTGAIHTEFNAQGAVTGRFSSSNPNMQNIPSHEKRIRKMFKAREGYLLMSADFSQIEPRTLASLSGDEGMLSAYRNGQDLYAIMAAKVYNLPVEACKEFYPDGTPNPAGKERRSSVKSVLLGLMYKRGAKAIAEQFGKDEAWGEEISKTFLNAFPAINLFDKMSVHEAETFGFVTTADGRKRRLPDMQLDRTQWKYQEAYRQVVNAKVQGTAADIMKAAMVKVEAVERLQQLDVHMLLTVHDELICEVPKDKAVVQEAAPLLTSTMMKVGEDLLGVPMKCDVELTEYWYGPDLAEEYGV